MRISDWSSDVCSSVWMHAVLPKPTAANPGPAARRARVSPPRAVLLWLVLLPLLGLLALRMEWGAETDAVSGPVFTLCGVPPHRDCVIDGDNFYLDRQAIRIADIDAPETHSPHFPEIGIASWRERVGRAG